ncbi:MAG: type II toxin-antitoxin system PemK/MazF family toxin [Candidatus Gracilibacteria bacterium]|nr:type II toxin-antitoxin system PemK/MazF family toxin [Candidatus Gracilibacteria bacterium]
MYKTKLNRILNLIENIKNDINLPIISDFLEWFFEKIDIHFNNSENNLIINKGEIYYAKLGRNIGKELNKTRPCLVYSTKIYNRGDTILVIPLKSYKGKINTILNTFIKSGNNNLTLDSISDLCALKQISKKRLLNKIGNLSENDLIKIDRKIVNILGIIKEKI